MNFNGNPALTITVHYSTVEGNIETEEPYNQPTAAVKEVLKHILIVLRDFIAHPGRDIAEYSFHESSNNNGKLMHDFIEESSLCITNTFSGKAWEALDIDV